MLKIYLGNMEKAIYHPPTYFDNQYEDEWLTDKTAIQMIRDVDHSEVMTINLRHVMNFGNGPFQIKILNTDSIVTNMLEFVQIAGNFV